MKQIAYDIKKLPPHFAWYSAFQFNLQAILDLLGYYIKTSLIMDARENWAH